MILKMFLKTIQVGKKSIPSSIIFKDERTLEKGTKTAKFALEPLAHAPLHMRKHWIPSHAPHP